LRFLVTGGTGSFGRVFIPIVLRQNSERVVALARHEKEMHDLEQLVGGHPNFRAYLGDVRDPDRLEMAMQDIDTVIHGAALKRIEQCERDPIEAIKTNVSGSVNVITAALRTHVNRAVLLSTDKASGPINLYGATKLCAERAFIAANNLAAGRCKFSVARYGNIAGSRGSVIPIWREKIAAGLPITVRGPDCTRYFMHIHESVELVLQLVVNMKGGEIALPKLRAYRLGDLAIAMGAKAIEVVELPAYEKPHETLDGITDSSMVERMSIDELEMELSKL
jgi:UDP-N-acetylglucosamine 4,6-dehydratase